MMVIRCWRIIGRVDNLALNDLSIVAGAAGVFIIAARGERGQHCANVIVEEQHRGDDNVTPCDVGMAAGQRLRRGSRKESGR